MKKNQFLIRLETGVSLIEVIVSSVIVAFMAITLAYLFTSERGNIENLGYRRMALKLAGEKIERLKEAGYDSTDPETDMATGEHHDPLNPISMDDNVAANRSWIVEGVDDDADGTGDSDADNNEVDYKMVTVKVSWTFGGSDQSIQVPTYIAP